MSARPLWRLAGGRTLDTSRPQVMGILNVTPDSFSDGGELTGDSGRAVTRAHAMVEAGAALLDVGGESTRPGAAPVSEREEIRRVLPVIEALVRDLPVPVSVDTRKAGVARAALAAGAALVNDVSALAHDPAMAETVAAADAGLVLMHMRGEPADMMERAVYQDVVREVTRELGQAVARARAAGVREDAVAVDPGIGFAKTAEHNLALLNRLAELTELGYPILVGPSRKSFLGRILDVPPAERVIGTVAACVAAYRGGARVFRVHDVAPVFQGLRVAEAIARERITDPVPSTVGAAAR
jgi:dihydropteroate synthase